MPQIPGQMQLPIQGQPPQVGQRLSWFGRLLWANRADVTDPATAAWNRGTFWSWVVLWFLIISTTLIPLVALSGRPAIVAPMGLVPLAGLLALFLRPHGVSPLWGGVIAYWPDRVFENEKRRIPVLQIPVLQQGIPLGGSELRLNARRIAGVLFAEALLAEYYALTEYAAGKADTTLIFVSFVLFITAGLGLGSQPGKMRSLGLPLVAAAIIAVTIIFALGGKSGVEAKIEAIGNGDAKAAPAVTADRMFRIAVPGGSQKSEAWNINLWAPTEDDSFQWWGPPGTLAHFDDGTVVLLTEKVGKKTGEVRFTSPVPGEVRIEVTRHRG